MDEWAYLWRQHRKELRMIRRQWNHFLAGAVVAAIFILFGLYVAIANAQVPDEALRYRRDLMRNGNAIWGLGAPTATFAAQIHQESHWDPNAVSWAGAEGMAQFMPSTSNWIAEAYKYYLGSKDPYNPIWAIRALITYDRHLWDRVEGLNNCEKMAFALASYNGGLGWTYKRKAISPDPLRCLGATCEVNPGITEGNQRENQEYPKRILLRHEPKYAAEGFGSLLCAAQGM